MRIIDPGHKYALMQLDGEAEELLTYVKREGFSYPGNVGKHAGTNMQEVIRSVIDRVQYLDRQDPCRENMIVLAAQRTSLRALEIRAARRHSRDEPPELTESIFHIARPIEHLLFCGHCGHVGCYGESCR